MDSPTDAILVATIGNKALIKIEGKGSFSNSPALKQFYQTMIREKIDEFFVDLRNCPAMDSTFLGTLVALRSSLQRAGLGRVHLICPNPRNLEVIRNLGIDSLFEMDLNGSSWPGLRDAQALPPTTASRAELTQTSLEAHQSLVAAHPGNEIKFKHVIEFLKEDLDKLTNHRDP